jgi:hypothetical protein
MGISYEKLPDESDVGVSISSITDSEPTGLLSAIVLSVDKAGENVENVATDDVSSKSDNWIAIGCGCS